MARQAPPRHCSFCGADVTKLFDLDSHVARHLTAKLGVDHHRARRLSRNVVE